MFSNRNQAARELLMRKQISLHCEDCKAKGISPEQCNLLKHNEDMLPSHLASADQEKVKMLLPDEQMMGSEVYGLVRANKNMFDLKWIEVLEQRPRVILRPGSIEVCFTFVDPSGNGHQSDFAIVTIAIVQHEQQRRIVLLGLSRDRNDQAELSQGRCVSGHFHSLRSLQCLSRQALFVVFVENNYGGSVVAGTILTLIDRTPEFHPLERFNQTIGKLGVCNTPFTKEEGVNMGLHELSTENVYINQQLASSEPSKIKETTSEFLEQLKRVHRKIRNTTRGKGFNYEYTGKMSATLRDDLAFGFLYALQWTAVYQRNLEYRQQSHAGFSFETPSMNRGANAPHPGWA